MSRTRSEAAKLGWARRRARLQAQANRWTPARSLQEQLERDIAAAERRMAAEIERALVHDGCAGPLVGLAAVLR